MHREDCFLLLLFFNEQIFDRSGFVVHMNTLIEMYNIDSFSHVHNERISSDCYRNWIWLSSVPISGPRVGFHLLYFLFT